MNKIKQRIYEFGRVVNGMTITKNTRIKNSKTIPITFENKIIGQCVINTDDDGVICDGFIYDDNDIIVNNELQIGMFFVNEKHMENNLTILDNIFIANITK